MGLGPLVINGFRPSIFIGFLSFMRDKDRDSAKKLQTFYLIINEFLIAIVCIKFFLFPIDCNGEGASLRK
jgi:hypothetical protein